MRSRCNLQSVDVILVRKLLAEHLSRAHTKPRDPSGKVVKEAALMLALASVPTEPRVHTTHSQWKEKAWFTAPSEPENWSGNITGCTTAETRTGFTPKKNGSTLTELRQNQPRQLCGWAFVVDKRLCSWQKGKPQTKAPSELHTQQEIVQTSCVLLRSQVASNIWQYKESGHKIQEFINQLQSTQRGERLKGHMGNVTLRSKSRLLELLNLESPKETGHGKRRYKYLKKYTYTFSVPTRDEC